MHVLSKNILTVRPLLFL